MFKVLSSNLLKKSFSPITKRCSSELKEAIACKIPEAQEKIKKFRKEHDKTVVSQVIVKQLYGGMRGIKSMVCETSHLDPNEGIRFRGYTIPDCQEKLPKAECGEQPLPEGLFWLLCTGDIPTQDEVKSVSKEWALRSELPAHVCKFLNTVSKEVHPMAQLSAACSILNTESHFVKAYNSGVKKNLYWEHIYEDVMNLCAKVTPISALIYKNTYKEGASIGTVDTSKDWSHNFCDMLGFDDPDFIELMRMYLTIHSDHEGGNVSAHTTHLVASALSDPYLAYAAGMNGLAGPLHGLANQEVLTWLVELQKAVGDSPSEDKIKEFVQNTLKSGRVVPGYGHAVLRITDPRFTCQKEFAEKHLPDDPLFKIVSMVYKVVPPILKGLGKVQNPWPNVDAHSGVLLQYYGLTEKKYYTVLFSVSRALGVLASMIWSRIYQLPIERPKSLTTDYLMKMIEKQKKEKKCD